MKRSRTTAVLTLTPALIALLGWSTPAQATTAAPNVSPSACKASPSDANCDGVDPQDSGCAADAYTVTEVLYDQFTLSAGYVQLRYSPSCKTNWARWQWSSPTGDEIQMYVMRSDNKAAYETAYTPPAGATEAWSPMIYSPTRASKACVNDFDAPDEYYVQCTLSK